MEATTETQLHIFRTNIGPLCPNCAVHKLLDNHPGVEAWSLDTDDPDCVLRVASSALSTDEVAALIIAQGHQCTEL